MNNRMSKDEVEELADLIDASKRDVKITYKDNDDLGAGNYWPFSRITDSGLVGSIFLLCVTAIILFCIFTWFTLPLLLGDW